MSLLDIRTLFVIFATFSLSVLSFTIEDGAAQPAIKASTTPLCIPYDSKERLITVTCRSARLTDIGNKLKDENILNKEQPSSSSPSSVESSNNRGREEANSNTVWLLNAGLVIYKGATFYINSTDNTKWLKIIAGKRTITIYMLAEKGLEFYKNILESYEEIFPRRKYIINAAEDRRIIS